MPQPLRAHGWHPKRLQGIVEPGALAGFQTIVNFPQWLEGSSFLPTGGPQHNRVMTWDLSQHSSPGQWHSSPWNRFLFRGGPSRHQSATVLTYCPLHGPLSGYVLLNLPQSWLFASLVRPSNSMVLNPAIPATYVLASPLA